MNTDKASVHFPLRNSSNVSSGEMVGCDNDECPWEWFHIGCVGILPHNMPKGKWYCPECRKNVKGKR